MSRRSFVGAAAVCYQHHFLQRKPEKGLAVMPPPAIPPAEEGSFSAPASTHVFAGFLLDLDGTIIDSTDAIEKHWRK